MRVAFLVWATNYTGLGHWCRCQALAEAAFNRGHHVSFISNRRVDNGRVRNYACEYLCQEQLELWLNAIQPAPDWVVIDIPDPVPDFMWRFNVKRCLIDGIGHVAQRKADLNICQGFEGRYHAPEYVILRQHNMVPSVEPPPKMGMFVFGGAADKLGIAKRFVKSCGEIPANIVVSPMVEWEETAVLPNHALFFINDARIFRIINQSTTAVCHTGMICWELAACGIAPHVFSCSPHHLDIAKQLESAGYARAYDAVGLPESDRTLLDFLNRPTRIMGKPVDGRGAERVIKLMEAH